MLLGTHFAQTTGTGVISEIAANYRSSPLSETRHAPGKLRAGDRLPDLEVLASGEGDTPAGPLSLYGCLDPSRFTLLIAGVPDEARHHWPEFVETRRIAPSPEPGASAAFKHAFGGGPGFWLVRPDAYLGFVGGPDDLPTLTGWLDRWFPSAASRLPG